MSTLDPLAAIFIPGNLKTGLPKVRMVTPLKLACRTNAEAMDEILEETRDDEDRPDEECEDECSATKMPVATLATKAAIDSNIYILPDEHGREQAYLFKYRQGKLRLFKYIQGRFRLFKPFYAD